MYGCVSVCVDMTDRKLAEIALREADRRKDEFLATLSHELRNPLAPIRSALEVMRLARGDPEMVEKARSTMERQLLHLVRITDDLLDVARITQNKMELRRERIDLRVVLQSAIEASRPAIDARAMRWTVDVPARRSGPMADRRGWRRCSRTCSTTPSSTPNAAGRFASAARPATDSVDGDRAKTPASGSAARCCRASSTCSRSFRRTGTAVAGRARDRADAGQTSRRAARRHHRGAQRGDRDAEARSPSPCRLPHGGRNERSHAGSRRTPAGRARAASWSPKTIRTRPR